MIKVDLNTKVLPTAHRVVMVRPGSGYHLRKAFFENQAIAPDLANLQIPDGMRPRDVNNLNHQIKRSRELAKWVKTEETRSDPMPPNELAQYQGGEKAPRLNMYRNLADELLHSLPTGTLMYVPNPILTETAMFGELCPPEDPRLRFTGSGYHSDFTYLGRRLRNVKFLPMRGLPATFFPPMKKRNWTFDMDARSSELLYRQYYGDFELVGRKSITEIEVTKDKVYAPDLAIVGAVTNLVDQSIRRLEVADPDTVSLLDVVFLAPENDAPVIHANLGSQGEVLVEALKTNTARVVKVILALAVLYSANDIWNMIQNDEIELINSHAIAGVAGENLAETQQLTYDFVKATGRESLEDIVIRVREFHDRTGGKVDAAIINDG